MWKQFQDIIFTTLQYLQSLTGDWGVAIILLTVALRIVILPLTLKQTKSMLELQQIQPKIKELQAKYKDDKEKLQEETLKFYSENKVNPLGGCLPAILQMPIFFALFGVLRTLPTRIHGGGVQSFLGIIPNLSLMPKNVYSGAGLAAGTPHGIIAAIPYLILVLIFGVSIWLPQALMPGDKQQKMIGAYMAIVMLFFGWSSPAGVLLYWDVSSIWGVAQQQITMVLAKKNAALANTATPSNVTKPSSTPAKEVNSKKSANKTGKKSSKG